MNEFAGLLASGGSPPAEETSTAGKGTRASILMVDDHPAKLLTYEAVLNGLDVTCVRALSGEEALAKLLVQEFAVILLDVNMPGMDGFEVARLVRQHPRFGKTPIIFVTAHHVTEVDHLRGYEVGAIDYIPVPVAPEVLRSKVSILVELHRRRAQLEDVNSALAKAREQLVLEHARALAARDEKLRAVFDHPDQMAVVLRAERDVSGRVCELVYLDANRNAERMLGIPRAQLLGRRLSEVLPDRSDDRIGLAGKVLATGEPARYETRMRDVEMGVTLYPIGADQVVFAALDITDRKRAEKAVRDSEQRFRELANNIHEAMEQTDRRKDQFLAMLAHELRNPVAPIASAADALSRMLTDESSRRLATIIRRQAQALSRLLDDLLDVARITQGRIHLHAEVVALDTCIALALETAEPLIRERRHELTIGRSPELLYVSADRVRLAQCLDNLLTNAAKYTEPGGEIRIRPYRDGDFAVVEISDNGQGISAEFLPHMFELFAQSERTLDRSQGGLGIGLSVCRQLIEMQGGTVTGQSAGVGKGSTFTVRLPLAQPVEHSPPAADANFELHRILIVDDNRDAADSLAMLLQFEGHRVHTAYSAEEALQALTTFDPQVALLDIGLPGMNGYELARRLRELAIPDLRLIAVSGYGQPEDRQRAAAAGFDAHLIKPVALEQIQVVLSTPTAQRRP